MLDNIIYI